MCIRLWRSKAALATQVKVGDLVFIKGVSVKKLGKKVFANSTHRINITPASNCALHNRSLADISKISKPRYKSNFFLIHFYLLIFFFF